MGLKKFKGSIGKKFATGTVVGSQSRITVSGLSFKPSTIIIQQTQWKDSAMANVTFITPFSDLHYMAFTSTVNGISGTVLSNNASNYVNSTGFSYPIPTGFTQYTWWAYE